MIAHTVRSSWQTILADLSLILFMVTASALANSSDGPLGNDQDQPARPRATVRAAPTPIVPALRAEPVGVWRAAPGAPPLRQWLGEVARDPRLRLTITVHYAPGGREAALSQALRLDRAAGVYGETARLVVEPGQPAGASAAVGYDGADGNGARSGTQLAAGGT